MRTNVYLAATLLKVKIRTTMNDPKGNAIAVASVVRMSQRLLKFRDNETPLTHKSRASFRLELFHSTELQLIAYAGVMVRGRPRYPLAT